jgi:hypothetical protein
MTWTVSLRRFQGDLALCTLHFTFILHNSAVLNRYKQQCDCHAPTAWNKHLDYNLRIYTNTNYSVIIPRNHPHLQACVKLISNTSARPQHHYDRCILIYIAKEGTSWSLQETDTQICTILVVKNRERHNITVILEDLECGNVVGI